MLKKLFDLKSKLVPLAFGIFIVMSFMYIYEDNISFMLLFLVLSVVLQTATFIFYDYISTKSKIMQYISILGSFVAMLLLIVIIGSLYTTNNMVDFMVWFLSPQDVVDYSLQYIFVMLVGLNFFIASTIYYFTQVRYRMITTFFLFLMPFAIFTKEQADMPTLFIVFLIVLYFSTMIVCGQNNLYKQNDVKVLENHSYFKSIGTFVLAFLLIASAVPKPEVNADRDTFETLINANNFTNYLLSQIGSFTDTSNGTGYSYLSSNQVIFTAETSETVALKARTFSSYNYNKNVWLRTDGVKSTIEGLEMDTTLNYGSSQASLVDYDRYGMKLSSDYTNEFQESLDPAELLNAIAFACAKDDTFATEYNLNTFVDDTTTFNTSIKSVKVNDKYKRLSVILNPTSTFRVNPSNTISYGSIVSTGSGLYYALYSMNSQDSLINVPEYSVDYYSSNIIYSTNAYSILRQLNFDSYGDFLEDLSSLTKGSQFEGAVNAHLQDYQNALTYSQVFKALNNENISALAEDITKDCNSDIEKALALENYFISNGYTYDADYQQPEGSTIESFLFTTKTGACYEYSTSMVLMARALGLPARYSEGFLVYNGSGSKDSISVTANSSHAFPEVYISGYGWCYFEPTQVLLSAEEDTTSIEMSLNYEIFIVSCVLVTIAVIGGLFMILLYPQLYERHFRKRVLTKPLETALLLMVNRIRKVTKLPDTQTLEELQGSIGSAYGVDISSIVLVCNNAFYGNLKQSQKGEELVRSCLDVYILLYDTIVQTNKEQKKARKRKRKESKQ